MKNCNGTCIHCGASCSKCIGICQVCGCYCDSEGTEPKKVKKRTYVDYSFPTERQAKTLSFITMYTGETFTGRTKKEATIFISEHMDEAIINKEKYAWT